MGNMPITGIQFHRVSGSANKYFIFVTTPKRLYQFIGHATTTDDKTSLQSVFYPYLTMPETGFQEIQSSLKYSKLQFFFDKNLTPKKFGWLTEPGIFYGQVSLLKSRFGMTGNENEGIYILFLVLLYSWSQQLRKVPTLFSRKESSSITPLGVEGKKNLHLSHSYLQSSMSYSCIPTGSKSSLSLTRN